MDEGVPDVIQKRLSHLAIFTVREMGWLGVKNGILLDQMSGDFQIIVTTDKNLPHQQNLRRRQISVIILPSNDIPSIIEMLPQIEQAISTLAPGDVKALERQAI